MPDSTFQNGVGFYNGTQDTKIKKQTPNTNYNGSNLTVFFRTSPTPLNWHSLLAFSGIVPTILKYSICVSAQVEAQVTFTATSDWGTVVRRVEEARDWLESQATWNVYKTETVWETAGGTGAADSTVLFTSAKPEATGFKVIIDNDSTFQQLQQNYINGDRTDMRGVLMLPKLLSGPGGAIGMEFKDSETTTPAQRPKLAVGWVPPPIPRYAQAF